MTHLTDVKTGSLSRFLHEMREGARRQGNVIFALIFRDIKKRSGVDGYGLLTLLAVLFEPALGVAATATLWYFLRRQTVDGVPIVLFLAVSFTSFAVARRSLASVPRAIGSHRGFYSFPNVKPIDAVVARFTLELVLTIIGGTVVFFIVWWFSGATMRSDMLMSALRTMALLVTMSFGVSLFVGVYGTRFPLFFKTIQLLSRGLMITSAVFHRANEVPPKAQYLLSFNPIAHALELLRYELLGLTPFGGVSLKYLASWALVSLFVGMMSYYANRQKVLER